MAKLKNLLLVGGNGRNIGKTHLAVMAIEKLARKTGVVAVKISNVNPENKDLHGIHTMNVEKDFLIYEEHDREGNKDSMRFLKAGAKRSFFIISNDEHLQAAFQKLLTMISHGIGMVCESNSLRQWVEPGVLLMVNDEAQTGKKNVKVLLAMADAIVPARNQNAFEEVIQRLNFSRGKIVLSKQ